MPGRVVHIRKERCDIPIGRGTIYGNPYTHLPLSQTLATFQVDTREEAVSKYREYAVERIKRDPVFAQAVAACKDKVLGCYCHPLPCHGDILLELANGLVP